MSLRDGRWRPDAPFNSSEGLKVTMRRAQGLTTSNVLRVPLRFQVPALGDFARTSEFSWTTFDTISGGQHSRLGGKQLEEITFDTLLMDAPTQQASEGVAVWRSSPDPQSIIRELRYIAGMGEDGTDEDGVAQPFRLIVDQPAVWDKPVVSMIATLTNVTATQQTGEIGTEYLSLTFLQFRETVAKRQRRHVVKARRHTLVSGDTLHKIAIKFFHQASAWRDIAKRNSISGVSPSSAADLAAWAKRHHKKSLVIPEIDLAKRSSVSSDVGNVP